MALSWVGCQQEWRGLIKNGELSADMRKLEDSSPEQPVNSSRRWLRRLFVWIDGAQLRERDCRWISPALVI